MKVEKTFHRSEVTEIIKNHVIRNEVTGVRDFTLSFGTDGSVTVSYDTLLTKPSIIDAASEKATSILRGIREKL
jgi:hypothetical protein